MGSLFGTPKVKAAPPPPMVDDALARRNQQDRTVRRGRGTTVLTGDNGLPNLGSTTAPAAGGA